jgi:hypothetical protein
VFPNIELRLDVATARGGFVNVHLFVSPEDVDHVEQVRRLLMRLQFRAFRDRFDCTRAELIRLGRKADPSIVDDGAALTHGASQFNVNFNELRDVVGESAWAKKNILVAVAGSATDGTSGVREAADKTIREEIEKFADVIFASSIAQREYWLGERNLGVDEIRKRYNSLKPCLHGSDAHKLTDVGLPFGDRFSWIKGGLEFDALRQACIDPAGRACVGPEPPPLAMPSQVIAGIRIRNASWATTPDIPLNPGLVAIIGARGSGKTALVEMVAAGCNAIPETIWEENLRTTPSFLARARPLIGQARVELSWASGSVAARSLDGSGANDPFSSPHARYLSQQFVEELCSSNGLSDGLLQEIERVIFEAHPINDRDGSIDFAELLDRRATRFRLARDREAEAVEQLSERIGTELEKERLIGSFEIQVNQKMRLIADYTKDRAKLVSKGSEERVGRHTDIATAAEKVRAKMRAFVNQRQTFVALQDEVVDLRRNKAPEALRQTQARHPGSGMSQEQWGAFLLDYKGNVDNALAEYIVWAEGKISGLKGEPPSLGNDQTPYISNDADLDTLPLALLEAEMSRLEKLVSADRQIQRNYAMLTSRITAESAALETLKQKFIDASGAKDRRQQLQRDREAAYQRAFDAIIAEQAVLEQLYAPLMERLTNASGTLEAIFFGRSCR